MLLPEYLDDNGDENSPVRTVDAFADILDLAVLGFYAQPATVGRHKKYGTSICKMRQQLVAMCLKRDLLGVDVVGIEETGIVVAKLVTSKRCVRTPKTG